MKCRVAEGPPQPTPEEIRTARKAAGLTQAEAAQLISTAGSFPYRTWQNYEAPADKKGHRPIPMATWTLSLLLTDQHPTLKVSIRRTPSTRNSEG